jgi:hypothetical protein
MINNNYVYELDLDIDLNYIKQLILGNQFDKNGNKKLNDHQRVVSEDNYLTSIRDKFKFLGPIYNTYYLYPNNNIPPHVDAKRNCALNIPVCFTELSDTVFYKFTTPPILEYNENRVYHSIKSDIIEDFKFSLIRPALINNTIPHGVTNRNVSGLRAILSWSISSSFTFEQAREIFMDARL